MSQMRIQCTLADIELDATLAEGFNIFACESACGKTRAFRAIQTYSLLNRLKCKYVNYQNYEDVNWEHVKGFDIVIMDDADLYIGIMDYKEIIKNNKIVVSDAKQVEYTMNADNHRRNIYMNEDKIVIS